MKPPVIGLYSPAPQSGKSALARYLAIEHYTILPLARVLKTMVGSMLRELGYANHRDLVLFSKETMIPELGVSVRHLLQTLGTEWGRQCVHPDVWLRCWEAAAKQHLSEGRCLVVDDVRFPNEAALIRKYGGEMWLITRPGAERPNSHASEGGLSDINFDRHIENNGSLMDLYRNVDFISTSHAA